MSQADPEAKLAELGIELPEAPAPAAAYLPYVQSDALLFTAGQIATGPDGFIAQGIVGREIDLETAQACARQCAINILAQVKSACGDLSSIKRIVKISVFVANGASLFLAEILGQAGKHARSAVGVPSLPLNSPVEIEAIIELHQD